MPDRSPASRWSRESRLLLLTVAVCAGVLLLLARLRFPDAPPVDVSAPPLERLAARASYDALAADVQRAEQAIVRGIVTLRIAQRARTNPYDLWDTLAGSEAQGAVRHVVAMRTSADTALAPVGAQSRIEGIVGSGAIAAPPVLGIDLIRGWALVRVPAATEPVPQLRPISSLPTPIYVVVAEGTQAGATLRPVFLGQGARFNSVKWTRPLLPLGGIAISPGALLFTLDGEFIGAAVVEGGAPAIVGGRDLFDAASRLDANTKGTVGDIGVTVQRLTAELALATGVDRGVMIAEVDSNGPASSALDPGDVLTMIGGRPVADPGEVLLNVAQRRAGETLDVSFVRSGTPATATLKVRAASPEIESEAVSFLREPGVGTRVGRGGRDRVAGLQPGDVITRAAATRAPTPAQLRALLARSSTSGFLILVVRRDGRQQIIAAREAGGSDATPR
jgi:hypothetical protein